jgi:hypothetical protein
MTRFRSSVALVCFALVVTGCGGGKAKTAPTPTPLTATQAKALAAAGVLTADDLPGYTAKAGSADDPADQAALDACFGIPKTTYLAQDPGKEFTKGALEIDSSVDVVSTVAMAKAEMDAGAGPKGVGCIKSEGSKGAAKDGLTGAQVSATPQTLTVPGADQVLYFDLVLTGTSDGQQVEVHGSEAIARVGQTQIQLSTFAFAPPLPTSDEVVALLTKAVARVKAAS